MDNLPANKTPAIHRRAQRENVELCFTPASASWANPVQAQSAANASNAEGARNLKLPNRAGERSWPAR
jgi:hypothetical protein